MALKPEDLQKLAEYLDIQEVESFEDAKTKFDEVYARKGVYADQLRKDPEFINKIIGNKIGSIENDVKQFGKEFGVEFEKDEFAEAKKWEDISKIVFTKVKEKHKNTVTELESKVGADPSELVKEWEGKLATAKNEAKKWKGEFETLGQSFETYKSELAANMRKEKLNKAVESMFSEIPFADEALKDELKIAGFKTKILSEVNFDLDENDNFVLLGKDKMPITNPAKAGATYTPLEYAKEQAIKFDIFKLNDKGGNRAAAPVIVPQPTIPTTKQTGRTVHPSALQ